MGESDRDDGDERMRRTRLAVAGAVGASVAHELRNSLAVAESSAFLARRDIDDRARLDKHLTQLTAEIRKAQSVVGSVLGLARGEPVQREPSRASALIDAARHELTLPTNVTFHVSVDPPDLELDCDPVLLERVFSNLFKNALEAFAGRGRGAVEVRVRAEADRHTIRVSDDGNGLDPSDVERVFEPLFSDKPGGTGLGLALCRVIVEAHGGRIAAFAEPSSTSFELWLPR